MAVDRTARSSEPPVDRPACRGNDEREYIVLTFGGHSPLGAERGDYTITWALPKSAAPGNS